jgi:hypothetical protein
VHNLMPNYDFCQSLRTYFQSDTNVIPYRQLLLQRKNDLSSLFTNNRSSIVCSIVANSQNNLTNLRRTQLPDVANLEESDSFDIDTDSILLIGCTVPAMVDYLILKVMKLKQRTQYQETSYVPYNEDALVNTWLQTYQSINTLSAQNMLLIFIDRFLTLQQAHAKSCLGSDIERTEHLYRRMIALVDVIQCWLRHYINQQYALYYDPINNSEVKATICHLLQFIDEMLIEQPYASSNGEKVITNGSNLFFAENQSLFLYLKGIQLKNVLHYSLKHAELKRQKLQFEQIAEHPDIDHIHHLLDIPLDILADQLTVYFYELMRSIRNYEMCGVKWRYEKDSCPNVMNMLHQFGRLAKWVSMTIVLQETPEERAEMMRKFINLCIYLRERRNFQCTFAVFGGLNSAATYRMYRSKALLTKEEEEHLEDLRELVSLRENFQHLRAHLESSSNVPTIPYTGYYMGNLKSISDFKIPLLTETAAQQNGVYIINVYRLMDEYNIISEVEKWQHEVTYFSMHNPNLEFRLVKYQNIQDKIRETLLFSEMKSETHLFELSLRKEPRLT